MHSIWRDIIKNARVHDEASALLRACVQYCVRVNESAMDLAMDFIEYKSEAINKFCTHMNPRASMEAMNLIQLTMDEYNYHKEHTVKELVLSNYELAPLELECYHSTVIRIIFEAYFTSVPNTFPLPPKVLAAGVIIPVSSMAPRR